MAEFINEEVKHVGIGEPISFKNKTESPFTVSAGLIFHKDGEYHVSVHDNQIIVLNERPTADVETVKHGRWDYVTVVDEGFWRCSNCGIPSEAIGAKKLYKYCPFCGAKMGDDDGTN